MQESELDNVPGDIWQHLQVGRGAWRTPVLATVHPAGGADARVVVLRAVFPEEREVVFFTDRRSGKMEQLQADPHVCLAIYDEERELQARLYGQVRREQDEGRLDAWWNELGAHQHRLYAVDVLANDLSVDEEKGRENFAAFRVTIEHFHCLWIRDALNEAAQFTWRDGRWEARVVRP